MVREKWIRALNQQGQHIIALRHSPAPLAALPQLHIWMANYKICIDQPRFRMVPVRLYAACNFGGRDSIISIQKLDKFALCSSQPGIVSSSQTLVILVDVLHFGKASDNLARVIG